VHGLLDSSVFVNDPGVVGNEQIEKLRPLLISLEAVDWKTFAAVMLEVAAARRDVIMSEKGQQC